VRFGDAGENNGFVVRKMNNFEKLRINEKEVGVENGEEKDKKN
jgi:hypothetical protein